MQKGFTFSLTVVLYIYRAKEHQPIGSCSQLLPNRKENDKYETFKRNQMHI